MWKKIKWKEKKEEEEIGVKLNKRLGEIRNEF